MSNNASEEKSKIRQLRQRAQEAEAKSRTLQVEIERLQSRIQELESQLQNLAELKKELEALKAAHGRAIDEKQKLHSELSAKAAIKTNIIVSNIEKNYREIKKLKEESHALRSLLDNLKKSLKEECDRNEALEVFLKSLNATIEETRLKFSHSLFWQRKKIYYEFINWIKKHIPPLSR